VPGSERSRYSFCTHMAKWAGVEVRRHFVREELSEFPPPTAIPSYRYLTVDADVFDPRDFSAVNFPMPGPPATGADGIVRSLRSFRAPGPPVVGADIMEVVGDATTAEEQCLLLSVLRELMLVLTSYA